MKFVSLKIVIVMTILMPETHPINSSDERNFTASLIRRCSMYYMSKKYLPIFYSNLLYKMCNYFLDTQLKYRITIVVVAIA